MIAIVLVNWNGWRDTIGCIESCLALTDVDARIIVCDNASGDGSLEKIASWARGELSVSRDPASPVAIAAPRLPKSVALIDRDAAEAGDNAGGAELILVPTGDNLGFAGGNNVGLRWAMARGASHAWLLNNDTVVPPDALRAMVDFMASRPETGLCGSTMIEYHRPDTLQAYAGAMDRVTFRGRHLGAGMPSDAVEQAMRADPLRENEVLYPVGASMLASSAFLQQIGLMDEDYFLYYEEADWVLRAKGRFDVGIAADSRVFHKVGASAGSVSRGMSAAASGFLYRSRLRAADKFAGSRKSGVLLGILKDIARGVVKRETGRVIGASKALMGKVVPPNAG